MLEELTKKCIMFYNTTNLTGNSLINAINTARTQDDRVKIILSLFSRPVTPFEVQEKYNQYYKPAPITSIRRSLNTLTSAGIAEKTDRMRAGQYGKPNYTWQLKASNHG